MLLEVLKKSHMSSGSGSTAQTRVSAPRSKAVEFREKASGEAPSRIPLENLEKYR